MIKAARTAKNKALLTLITALAIGVASRAGAQPIISNATGLHGTFSVSNTDLINQGQPSLLSGGTVTSGGAVFGSVTTLNDGAVGALTTSTGFFPANGTVVLFTLDTTGASLGYDISSIVSLVDWLNTRVGENYTVADHTVGSGSGIFNTLASVNYPDPGGFGGSEYQMQVTITGTGGGVLASGVDQLQFTFFDDSGSGVQDGYREIDVAGSATVPEPSQAAMLAFGGFALIALRRRRTP